MEETKIPWGAGTPWKNSVAYFTWLRGLLRKGWSKHPTRIAVINKNRKQIANPAGKGKAFIWGFDCTICGGTFPIKECQVDHIVAAGSLTKLADIQGFVERLLYVTAEDLRLVCKECNLMLAYMERSGMSLEDARIEKQCIAIQKGDDKAWLRSQGLTPASNAKKRRDQIRQHLKTHKGE